MILLYSGLDINCPFFHNDIMKLVCPECKNEINFPNASELSVGSVLECNTCGITLEVEGINGQKAKLEVIDEGK
ncbi:hypothetical protein ISS21_02585 [Patescibacteria group bacterium]|nr:hypothetical protein [Patescibacteria group bacterium]